jgi:MinD superfamily P-loop ATPase
VAELDLALVFTPDAWVEELHRHLADHGGARVLHLVVDPAMALHERFDVLVASWRWPALTPGLVDELHHLGRAVLGVADRDERGAIDILTACGVDAIVQSDAAPWEYVDALGAIEPARPADAVARPVTDDAARRRRPHPCIAVCGPAGSGRTEIAIELARARGAVLVDADEVAPAVSTRLGLRLEPNVRNAIDAVDFGVGDIGDAFQSMGGLAHGVVCGVPNASAWSHIRPPELLRALHTVINTRDAPLVVDTASAIDDTGSGGTRGRTAVTRAVVAEADAVVVVGLATPLGVVRLLGWLADAQRLRAHGRVHVLLNRAPATPFRRAELSAELLRSCAPASLAHVPEDARVHAAGWNGALVARGPFTKAVATAAARLVDDETAAVAS